MRGNSVPCCTASSPDLLLTVPLSYIGKTRDSLGGEGPSYLCGLPSCSTVPQADGRTRASRRHPSVWVLAETAGSDRVGVARQAGPCCKGDTRLGWLLDVPHVEVVPMASSSRPSCGKCISYNEVTLLISFYPFFHVAPARNNLLLRHAFQAVCLGFR